jgi:SET domain-containing protein
MEVVAIRDIHAGEEITINYNGDPENQAPLWFIEKSARPKARGLTRKRQR